MHIARMLLQTWEDEIQAQTPWITTSLGHLVRENHLSVDCGLRAALASKRKQSSSRAPKSAQKKSSYIKGGLTGSKKNIESCDILKIDGIGKILHSPRSMWRKSAHNSRDGVHSTLHFRRDTEEWRFIWQTPTSPWPAKLCIFRVSDD